MKVSDYIVCVLESHGINAVFSITGGFAMHLNDSFEKKSFKVYYQHHEQSCAYSAVGYTKASNIPSVVCTTAGVAATNAISPCLVAYQDSVPVLFISGQVKHADSINAHKDKIDYNVNIDRNSQTNHQKPRSFTFSDCDIVSMVSSITKYSHQLASVNEVRQVMSNTIHCLISGRPGPVWLSIPIDIQGMIIYEEIPKIIINNIQTSNIQNIQDNLNQIYEYLKNAKRPIIISGNGINLSGCRNKLTKFIDKQQVPVVTTSFIGLDIIESKNPLFLGRIGVYGDRSGNFSIQNSDLILVLGSSLCQSVMGYCPKTFARDAKILYIDNDISQLEKFTEREIELKIHMDLNSFFDNFMYKVPHCSEWVDKCKYWKEKWFLEMPPGIMNSTEINPYYALKELFTIAPENKIVVCMAGSIITNLLHMMIIKKNDKFITNGQGDMGAEIPSAIGCQLLNPSKMVIAIVGDGSFQLNIQELQTIVHHNLPIKMIIFNNGGYGAISITQKTYFKNKAGVDKESGLSFPDTSKIAFAYGIKYMNVSINDNVSNSMLNFINYNGPVILEVVCTTQVRYPKLSAIKNEDGSFTNRPFEDMEPFMPRDEFIREMIVDII